MGLLLIFLGLLTAGVLADYVSENHLLNAPNQTIMLFGTKVTVSGVAPLVAAFLAGVLTLLLIVVGVGLLRGSWGRRRNLKRRIAVAHSPSGERACATPSPSRMAGEPSVFRK